MDGLKFRNNCIIILLETFSHKKSNQFEFYLFQTKVMISKENLLDGTKFSQNPISFPFCKHFHEEKLSEAREIFKKA
jgi:hypothetical protein